MACLEITCHDAECGFTAFSNERLGECPECGSTVSVWFDEWGDESAARDDYYYGEDYE